MPPSFSITDVKGRTFSSAASLGKLCIVFSGAGVSLLRTGGVAIPAENLYKKFSPDDLIVTAFTYSVSAAQLRAKRIDYPALHQCGAVFKAFNISGVPYTVIIDQDGIIRSREQSYLEEERIAFIRELIKKR